jgi:hypothetical protein
MFGSSNFKSRLKGLSPQAGQQPTPGAPKGFLGKFLNSSKLDAGQRDALMSAMNAKAPMRGGMSADRGMMRPRMEMDVKKKGGKVKAKKMAAGGSTASKRADGCATKGKTKGRFV